MDENYEGDKVSAKMGDKIERMSIAYTGTSRGLQKSKSKNTNKSIGNFSVNSPERDLKLSVKRA